MPTGLLTRGAIDRLVLSPAEQEAIKHFLDNDHPATASSQPIANKLREVALGLGYSDHQLANQNLLRQIAQLLFRRFCGVADTPRQTSGTHPLAYGTPIGRWTRGNLSISVDATGCKGVTAADVDQLTWDAYMQYQAVCPFFSFRHVDSGGDLHLKFGDSSLDSRLGNGAIGVGAAPPHGDLYLDIGAIWTPDLLLAVLLHEAGHTLGLGHSTSRKALMYPAAPLTRVLDPETIEAIRSLYDWQPQIPLPNRASSHAPSMANVTQPALFGPASETLYMAWKGTVGDSGLYFASSADGVAWTPQQKIPNTGSSHGPSLVAYHPPSAAGTLRAGLFMAWKGVGDDHNIYWARNPALTGWTGQQRIAVGTSERPALVEFGGTLVLAWKGLPGDSGIYWSTFDGANAWSPQQLIAGRGTSSGPALAVYNGELHMFWKGVSGDNNAWHARLVDPANRIWGPQEKIAFIDAGDLSSGETPVPIGTSDALVATQRGNELVLAWKGIPGDHALWFSRYRDGEFSGQMSVPNVGSEAGPAIALLGGKLVLAWRGIGDDHNLWMSSLG
ncbi:matrixin family metalloprotease [Paraburkholderia sp. J63]|uniref:matrixin family metalloprotease n=1 Tax=Paraburkholderia sp. J63 TaxID=2805434 RepID=UPI002ABD1FEE|nr:matrixin family metalloprotease [Paraburkholderia sp. J63]